MKITRKRLYAKDEIAHKEVVKMVQVLAAHHDVKLIAKGDQLEIKHVRK